MWISGATGKIRGSGSTEHTFLQTNSFIKDRAGLLIPIPIISSSIFRHQGWALAAIYSFTMAGKKMYLNPLFFGGGRGGTYRRIKREITILLLHLGKPNETRVVVWFKKNRMQHSSLLRKYILQLRNKTKVWAHSSIV